MTRLLASTLAFAAALLTASGASAGCVQAGGEATMVTQDLAKFMASAALKNSIEGHGWKAQGPVTMTCDTNVGLPHCVAKQKACG